VARCSAKYITYATEFKLTAIKLHHQGQSATRIFREAGFDLRLVDRNLPYKCLNRWLRTCKLRGIAGLTAEKHGSGGAGGRLKLYRLTEAEKIKRLETELAYLKAENDFLAKLRASRTG